MQLTLDTLTTVNSEVNSAVTYTPDSEKYHRDEWWEDALDEGNQGDCEDYAIAKLRKLLALDAPREALKIALCTVETGEYHCVLIAQVGGEDYVLDNRTSSPTRWEQVRYEWDKFYLLGERVWRAAK